MPKKEIVIYPNLDLYPSSKDVNVSFYQELYKYKSVQDYLDSKKKKKRRAKKRKVAFAAISSGKDVNFLDFAPGTEGFPVDAGISGANQIGGLVDHATLSPDEYGRNPYGNLNYAVGKDSDDLDFHNLEQEINEIMGLTEDNPTAISGGISNFDSESATVYDSSGYDPSHGYNITDVGTGIYNPHPIV